MLWNEIYIFFVKYVFGGDIRVGNNVYQSYDAIFSNINSTNIYGKRVMLTILGQEISFGNYMSLIATAITTIFIVVLCCLFVYKIVRLIGGLIRR